MSAELRNIAMGMFFGSILGLLSLGYIANFLYGVNGHDKLADPVIEGAEETVAATGNDAAKAAPKIDMAALIAAADTAKGAKTFKKKCIACHSSEQGGKHKTGPNLFKIAQRGIGKAAGFKYSKGVTAKNAEQWTDESLNSFLTKPNKFIKGTKMSFAGLKKPKDRANLIAFLKGNK